MFTRNAVIGCLALSLSAAAADVPKLIPVGNVSKQARDIHIHAKDVPDINCHVNVPTIIALPEGEEALLVQGGDAAPDGTWRYETAAGGPARRYVTVKPSLPGSSAGLHIISNHNLLYNFVVREVSNTPAIEADVSVFLIGDSSLAEQAARPPVLVSAEEVTQYKVAAEKAQAQLEEQRKSADASVQTQVNQYRSQYSKQLDHGYSFDRLKAPFNLTDVATDGTSTFVYVDRKHTRAGAIYAAEGKKGKPSIPNYDYDAERGLYTIQGVLDKGYLALKDDRVDFARLKGGE